MKKNSISRFFEGINLTYEDLPYLYIPLFAAIGLVIAGWYIWGEAAVLWGILILATYLVLATQYHLYRSSQKNLENHQKKIQAYFSLYSKIDFKGVMPYMTGWSATPELALIIYQEIRKQMPNQILEVGSGISTLIASYGLEQNGQGSIISIDHDAKYAEKTKQQLRNHDLKKFAQVKVCPLVPYEIEGAKWQWYELENLELTEKVDMLLIDGPPLKTNKYARYPALPLLIDHLSDQAVIIVHDAYRPSEADILEKWQQRFPELSCEIENTEKGIAILRK